MALHSSSSRVGVINFSTFLQNKQSNTFDVNQNITRRKGFTIKTTFVNRRSTNLIRNKTTDIAIVILMEEN
jgi:hypothetical protein